jgi:hypothetical protein
MSKDKLNQFSKYLLNKKPDLRDSLNEIVKGFPCLLKLTEINSKEISFQNSPNSPMQL